MLFLLLISAAFGHNLTKRNEEYQPFVTPDFPHLIGLDRLQAWMNPNLDPCQDFYAYSCDGFEVRYEPFKNVDILQLMSQSNAVNSFKCQ